MLSPSIRSSRPWSGSFRGWASNAWRATLGHRSPTSCARSTVTEFTIDRALGDTRLLGAEPRWHCVMADLAGCSQGCVRAFPHALPPTPKKSCVGIGHESMQLWRVSSRESVRRRSLVIWDDRPDHNVSGLRCATAGSGVFWAICYPSALPRVS
jgi:hypothetical protein